MDIARQRASDTGGAAEGYSLRLLAILVLLMVGATARAMLETAWCKKGGGVRHGTMCESPAR